ncbi:MAG: hypothetical protein IKW30_00890 [Lachnospiraceae bacterium]|nr:hypothetical protein [Lachnospiraceae bacterium]
MSNLKEKDTKEALREEIKKIFQDFLAHEGKLPIGFSEPYNKISPSGYIYRGTPFHTYLNRIENKVDLLMNQSKISDWLYFDGTIEINTAVKMIVEWARLQKEEDKLLREKRRRSGNSMMLNTISTYCNQKLMVVTNYEPSYQAFNEESIRICKSENISFCTILSECSLYDYIEQKEVKIEYTTFWNYHDETYGAWWLESVRI